ncbi:MAG: CpsD/CapB family tyrosine-protein kinase [Chloroflexi bacterium]|nr:CpsD/CapB family tyrosine-protein kinase [Chloroflexota bacterium]MCY3583601.1 CpsD/CapB family tyrosine-protein kinase [Chloroflexota bacterium]MCY3715755.1 CpsD/CapB family tyrosine-protein kinase [Chloroflexota bacterium]MDE2651274.1 CpsD/CapB family tyrosine-protein kinase [Chloroflexota bacterium]MXV93512.1 CpsD/CapB family tyrosine-protein kinase [Chloroflexota bacterium]
MAMPALITLSQPRSAAAEAYRSLRTNLMFSSVEKPIKTLLVTSAAREDHKSATLANLAVTFAQGGNRTILVDADLRQPQQHTIWTLENQRGLSQMMVDDAALKDPPLQDSPVDNLQLLCTGELPPNPADLLGGKRMSDIIAALKQRADYVLFDSPPVLAATDAALLGIKLDAALLAVRAGDTRRDHTAQARQALERVHVRIVGAVLTNAPRENQVAY